MGRGPGPVQRALLEVTGGGLVATTRSVLLSRVPEPTHADEVTIKRATRQLAIKGMVMACYVRACRSCGTIIIPGMTPCCQRQVTMLAVAPPGATVPYLAPPPVRPAPSWVCAVPSPLPRPQPTALDGVLDAIVAEGYDRLRSGRMRLSSADWIAAMRLQHQIRAAADPDLDAAKDFIMLQTDRIFRWLGPDRFQEFHAEISRDWKSARARRRPARASA